MIRCGYCKTLMLPPQGRTGPAAFRPRPEIPLPPGMNLQATVGGLKITRRWFTLVVLFLIPFCIAWDSFLIGWYTMTGKTDAPLVFSLFPLIHVAVGVGLTYFTLATLINKSIVEVNRGVMTISHGPLPWTGWREIPAGLIDQLYCKEIINRGKNGPSISYEVWVALNNGTSSKLLGAGLEMDQALYIEQQIERYLDLKDKPMSGEVRRV